MSLALTIKAMVAAGCSVEQIAAVADQFAERDREAIAAKRSKDAERKRKSRASAVSQGQAVTPRTDCDIADIDSEQYIARADAPVCSNDISNEISKLDTPDLKVCPPTEQSARSARLILFDRFYAAYPKHTNRKAAEAKFLAAVRSGVDAERIIAAAARFAEAHKAARTEPKYVMAPDVWLNKGKWDDEDLPEARAGPSQGGGWAKQLVKLEQNAREQPTESGGTVEAIPWLSERKDQGRRADDAHDGGVSRNPVELLVGNSFRRM